LLHYKNITAHKQHNTWKSNIRFGHINIDSRMVLSHFIHDGAWAWHATVTEEQTTIISTAMLYSAALHLPRSTRL